MNFKLNIVCLGLALICGTASAQIRDGSYDGTMQCGASLTNPSQGQWTQTVKLQVSGSSVLWERSEQKRFTEVGMGALQADQLNLDLIGSQSPGEKSTGQWRTAAILKLEGKSLSGSATIFSVNGKQRIRDCLVRIPVEVSTSTVASSARATESPTSVASAGTIAGWTAGQKQRFEVRASNPPSREALIRNHLGPEVTIWGDLLMPTKYVEGKVPAAIFSHGSEGVSSMYFDVYAKALNDAGYAVFVVDSFKPRGEDKIAGSNKQFTWNTTLNISDALYALKFLAAHPQIDKDRIFHMGWSRGGSAVLAAAWPVYQQNILPLDVKWAGSIAFYPGCNFRFSVDRHSSLPSPMLMLLGEKDDMTPAPPCVEYAQALAAKGNNVSYKVYPGAYHVFDWLNQPWRRYIGYPYRNCNLDVPQPFGPGDPVKWAPIFNRDTGAWITTQEEHKAYLAACAKPDYITTESNPKAREQAVKDVLAFLGNPK